MDPSIGTGDKNALKILLLELSGVIIVTALLVIVLNYFNIISFSSMVPALSFLPRAGSNTMSVRDAPSPARVKSAEELTAEDRIFSFANSALQPTYRSQKYPELVKGPVSYAATDLSPYHTTYAINNERIELADFGTVIDIIINRLKVDLPELTAEKIFPVLSSYFVFPAEISSASLSARESLQGYSVFEASWSNPDGTKDARSFREISVAERGRSGSYYLVACHLFSKNVGYPRGSCFEDLKSY